MPRRAQFRCQSNPSEIDVGVPIDVRQLKKGEYNILYTLDFYEREESFEIERRIANQIDEDNRDESVMPSDDD